MTVLELTAEQKLTQIIEAQAKGGCDIFQISKPLEVDGDGVYCLGHGDVATHILEILLDREGLRAAYGRGLACKNCAAVVKWDIKLACQRDDCWHPKAGYITRDWAVAHMILLAWLADGAEEAIDTAHSLLPNP
jgi:hypothetical protein